MPNQRDLDNSYQHAGVSSGAALLRRPNTLIHELLEHTKRPPWPIYSLPFHVKKYEHNPEPEPHRGVISKLLIETPIDPGLLPPNFVHTWAIDVRFTDPTESNPNPVDRFRLGFDDVELDWSDDGDVLTVIDSSGRDLATFKTLDELLSKPFECPFTPFDSRPFKRLYLELGTSGKNLERRFIMSHLITDFNKPPETAEVRLVEDDVNYETTEPFVEAVDRAGNPLALYPPWSAGAPTSGTTPEGSPIAYPKPTHGDGWYLIGENVTDTIPGFYTLLYYNEYESKLRAYLYNLDITGDASGFFVQLAMVAKQGGQYQYIDGALFPVHPNCNRWSSAIGVVPAWARDTWVMIETPMLYPMASNLPLEEPPAENNYSALYESRLAVNARNVQLQIKVAPYQIGRLRGDLVGKAIGEAIQQLGETGTLEIVKGIFSGIKDGKDWSKGASDFSKELKGALGNAGPTTKEIGEWLSLGASAFAGPLGAAGAALSLIQTFFIGKEPLRMTIELALTGQLTGEVFTDLQFRTWECYLPGRFSVREAFNPNGLDRLPKNSRRYIDSKLPRYDRTMGLFGFGCSPSHVVFELYRLDRLPYNEIAGCDIFLPNSAVKLYDYAEKPWDQFYIGSFLPVIFNRFPNIRPLASVVSGNSESDPSASRMYCKLFFDEVVSDLHDGYPNTPHDQVRGFELNIQRSITPDIYGSAQPYGFRVTSTVWRWPGGWPSAAYDSNRYQPVVDRLYVVIASKGQGRDENKWDESKYDYENISPLHDVVYYWNLAYEVTDRSGMPVAVRIVKLSAPVSIKTVRGLYEMGDDAKPHKHSLNAYPSVQSMLLR